MLKAANILSFLAAVSPLWIVGGVRDVILAVVVATNTAPRTLLGCAWMCGTFALKQTWIGLSRLGSAIVCYFRRRSSPTCMWSGTIVIGLARGTGSANALSVVVLRGGNISGLIPVSVRISGGTIRSKCFSLHGAFRSMMNAGPLVALC